MEKYAVAIDGKIKEDKIYEAHQYAMSMARRIRKKDPSLALELLSYAILKLSPFEDTLEIAKYPLVMAKEDTDLTKDVVNFCVDATLNWGTNCDWILEWDKVCIQFNNQQGNSNDIPTAFAVKYLSLGLLEQAKVHLKVCPLNVLFKAIELLNKQQVPAYKKVEYYELISVCVMLLAEERTECAAIFTEEILKKELYLKEKEIFEILYAMARVGNDQSDKKSWIRLRMMLDSRIGSEYKPTLDLAAHKLFQMPYQKQMTMSDMMKSMMG